MATIIMCTRCEALTTSGAAGIVQYKASPVLDPDTAELCPACVAEFMIWLDSFDVTLTPRERSYKKPWEPSKDTDILDGASTEQLAALLFQRTMADAKKAIESAE